MSWQIDSLSWVIMSIPCLHVFHVYHFLSWEIKYCNGGTIAASIDVPSGISLMASGIMKDAHHNYNYKRTWLQGSFVTGLHTHTIQWSLLGSYVWFTTASLRYIWYYLLLRLCTTCHYYNYCYWLTVSEDLWTIRSRILKFEGSRAPHCIVQWLKYAPVARIIGWQTDCGILS